LLEEMIEKDDAQEWQVRVGKDDRSHSRSGSRPDGRR
jgi:hypothetical protein